MTLADTISEHIEDWESVPLHEENLVVTDDHHIRYIDSFEVFLDPNSVDQSALLRASMQREEYLRNTLEKIRDGE